MLSLVKANISDCDELHDIRLKAFSPLLEKYRDYETSPAAKTVEHLIAYMQNDSIDFYFICLDDIKNIGYIRVKKVDENKCDLSQIAVLPEYQGNGYAQSALKQVEKFYPSCKVWELATIKQEDKLRHLYEKMGYKLTGKEEQKIKDGMDIIIYEKNIY